MIQKKYIKPTTRVVLVDVEELMDRAPYSNAVVSNDETSVDDVIIDIDNSSFGSSNSGWDDEDEAL